MISFRVQLNQFKKHSKKKKEVFFSAPFLLVLCYAKSRHVFKISSLQGRLQKMLLQTQNLRVTFSEAFLELGHFESHSGYVYNYHLTTPPNYLNSFSQNSFPSISSKVNQVGSVNFFTNWPIKESLAISVRKWGLETMNIPFLQRLSMTLVLRKSLRKPKREVRTMDIMMKSSSFPVWGN